ncbi:putative ribonuclease H-like domain-containing protein [Tanacetum coccineum]
MDLETAQTTTTTKLPIRKQGEYNMWRLRIEQYFQVQDYALWDVIEYGNLFKPVTQTTTNSDGTSTSLIPGFFTPKFDLSNSGLKEFQQPEFEGYGPKTSKSVSEKFSKEVRESSDTPLGSSTKRRSRYVPLGRKAKGRKITGKGTLKTGKLDFEDVYFVKELQFNLFSVLQMCDKKNSVLFTDTGCFVLSPDFKLADESQNGVAERKNRTLIEAARTMLDDSKLPTTFWAEVVNTACNVQNRVLVIKPHNKTLYELFHGRTPSLSFMRPFRCHVTILNTLDHLGKFDGKVKEGFFVRYSVNSKAFRVFNSRTRIVEETLYVTLLENKPNVAGSGPSWLFDIDTLTKSINYKPVVAGNQSNGSACTKACDNAGKARVETIPGKYYILLPLLTQDLLFSSSSKDSPNAGFKPLGEEERRMLKFQRKKVDSTVNTASINDNAVDENIVYGCEDDPNMPNLEEIVYLDDDEDVVAEADDTHIPVSPIPTTRIHKDHPVEQIIRDIHSAPQTRRMTKHVTNHVEPKKDSPFNLEAYTDSDYAGASLDRKSTTGGYQFIGSRLISWQCKKKTIVANSTTEAEYVAVSNCCGHVLWIQNQMLDYGYNFMNTKIFIDNESTICIVKNPVFHSKTKHIEIKHHFIRDSYEKILIQVIKIHTDHNVADLLTKAFDVSRFLFLTASVGMLNL